VLPRSAANHPPPPFPSSPPATAACMQVDPGYAYPAKAPSKKAFNVACGDACGNAEASASAMAQASACAFNRATAGCSAVTAQVSCHTGAVPHALSSLCAHDALVHSVFPLMGSVNC